MARSHHRKKHKEQLRQFKHKEETTVSTPKSKASNIFAIIGAIIGLAVSYFASEASVFWILIGFIAGAIGGYLIGRRVDAGN
jgi:VIT1/CCC1 family predicted Fe2+/Mn2+ transporter